MLWLPVIVWNAKRGLGQYSESRHTLTMIKCWKRLAQAAPLKDLVRRDAASNPTFARVAAQRSIGKQKF